MNNFEYVSKIDLKNKIEDHIHRNLDEGEYEIHSIQANNLFKNNTFDLAFKLFYLEFFKKNINLARDVYYSHIKAYNFFKIKEYGNKNKSSLEIFEKSFIKTFKSINKDQFNSEVSIVPLSQNGNYLNGSHRISIAGYLNKKINVLDTKSEEFITYDYNFFYKRAVPVDIIEKSLKSYLNYLEGVHIAFIWPSALGKNDDINKIIKNRIYYKEIVFNAKGAHNLLAEVYKDQKWIGNSKNNYNGTIGKLKECFKNINSPTRIIVFQEENKSALLKIKEKIRKIFKIEKHSIHITDTKEEVKEIAKLIFNKNGIHFLNNAKPYNYNKTESKIIEFKKHLELKKINQDDIVISGSFVLETYGLREARDIDYITKINKKENNLIMMNYESKKEDLIYNDDNFFEFNGLKFISFNETYKMKLFRNESKDQTDVSLMKSFLKDDTFSVLKNRVKQNFYFTTIYFKVILIKTLKMIKLHRPIKLIAQFLKIKF